ncbi:MAG TPA: hypothetical protein VLX28_05635 [Thermoanaerobaculia bacterium]|nr:hypothetical protein [Thermoanaerobaculia bacterium]
MSFKAREIMIDVLPARAFPPGVPGFALCTEVTRNEDEEDELDCEVTRPPAPPSDCLETDLTVLRLQLRQAMSA